MAQKDPDVSASRLLAADGSALGTDVDDEDIVDWDVNDEFIVAVQLDEAAGPWTASYKLQWRVSGGTYADLAASGAALIQGTNTRLTDGNALTGPRGSGYAMCINDPGGTWREGEEVEGNNTTDSFELLDEYYTEIQFAVNPSGAVAEALYEFQVVDSAHSDTVVGTLDAQITMAAAGPITINVADGVRLSQAID